jgi:ribose-phosphate pyrophosphokinase
LNEIAITNSVPPFRLTAAQIRNRLTILNAAPLFAEAIKRIHLDGSIVELLSL